MKKSKVAVLKTSPETVLEDYVRLTRLAEIEGFLDKSAVTILKDNISWHLPMPSANTTPWQLEGTIMSLRSRGFEKIVAVENKTVVTRPKHGEKSNKFDIVYSKYQIPVLYNFEEHDMKWIDYKPKAKLRALDRIFPEGIKLPDYFFGKNIVHLPTMKCHIYTTTTGAMKNAFGGLLNTKRHYAHSWIHETLVDLLKIQKEIHSGIFAVMDGTTAGNGPGPRTLKPVQTDLILASGDQVAIDAVAAKIMGFDPMTIDYIKMADEEGLGNGRLENIEIVGHEIGDLNYGFTVGDNLASRVGDLLWFGPLKRFQRLFFRTPLVYIFVLASEIYHDRFWWNFKGKKIFEEWKRTSPWGRLWERYR
ncbi:MAG TPA: DUF362 domain-containing protein [Pseudothermotoga sp.]|mgnify:CR=1 FL=1|nr:DUF362 domain-containing protein [Pseudothermotoga sp.]HOK82912.1 DUF362 domain-containing protein [Pseudothermotoga sp.]HPP69914.1 DUF362 domain-containing protein [Pseudothermotoga sp.]